MSVRELGLDCAAIGQGLQDVRGALHGIVGRVRVSNTRSRSIDQVLVTTPSQSIQHPHKQTQAGSSCASPRRSTFSGCTLWWAPCPYRLVSPLALWS